jgi:hypothetical protein
MRIKVLQNFGGAVTNERRVLPGEYDASDERLCGAAAIAFMLETRAAVVIDGAPAVIDEPADNEGFDALSEAEQSVDDGAPVTLEYIGTNARMVTVTVDGTEYSVPKADGDAPRFVTVDPAHADNLIERGTFRVATGGNG